MAEEAFPELTVKITAANIVAYRDMLRAVLEDENRAAEFLAAGARRAIFDGDSFFYELATRGQIDEFVKVLGERIRVLHSARRAFLAG